jgi:hypothetical protein
MRQNKAVVCLKTIRFVGFILVLNVLFFFGHFYGGHFLFFFVVADIFVFLHFCVASVGLPRRVRVRVRVRVNAVGP